MKFVVDTLDIKSLESNASQTIVLHGGAGRASIGHLRFWIPIFEHTGVDFIILTRDLVVYTALIEEFSNSTIVYAKNPLDVEEVITKSESLSVVFYTSTIGKNIHLLRFNHLKHIYIGSKDSDQLSQRTKFYRAYDEIYISSDSQIDRFREVGFGLGHLKFIKIGKPHLLPILKHKKEKKDTIQISYFPSWEGSHNFNNLSSLDMFSEILYEVSQLKSSLFVKFHNKMGKRDKTLRSFSENIELISQKLDLNIVEYQKKIDEFGGVDNTLKSDLIICDIETLSLDYLALNVPIFLYIPQDKNLMTYLEKRYLDYDYTYTFSTIEELVENLQAVLSKKDILEKSREEAIEYWIGKQNTLSHKFMHQLQSIASGELEEVKDPLISVIIPLFNATLYIEDTIRSIMAQSYKNIEIIVVDDGSTDNSVEVVEKLIGEDSRIRLFLQPNRGAGGARNHGLREAQGEYIRFVDSDDLLPIDSTQNMLQYIMDYDTPFVMAPIFFWWSETRMRMPRPHAPIYKEATQLVNPRDMIILGENASCCNKLYKKSFLEEKKILFPEGVIAEDVVFTFSTYLLAKKIVILPQDEIVYHWRVRQGSVSRSGYSDKYIGDRLQISNLMEEVIMANKLAKTPLAIRIRKRNINSILDILKSNIDNFTEIHFNTYKRQLLELEREKFSLTFNPNNLMRQILYLIKKYDYQEAMRRVSLLINTKRTSSTEDTYALASNRVEKFILEGKQIMPPNETREDISRWGNNDSLFFSLEDLKIGRYIFVFEYTWNSKKIADNYRLGTLVGEGDIFVNILFPRTQSWKDFEKIEVVVDIKEERESRLFQLRSINKEGVGFINLKSISFSRVGILTSADI